MSTKEARRRKSWSAAGDSDFSGGCGSGRGGLTDQTVEIVDHGLYIPVITCDYLK